MFLFLDVISTIPEFFVIEDNKLIIKRKILSKETEKLSDNIIQAYIELDNEIDLTKNLKKVALTVGPGSYTSLRVGASFISGLAISRKLMFCPISANDILNFKSNNHDLNNVAIYISSAQNQKFICYKNSDGKIEYLKIENIEQTIPDNIKSIFYNLEKLKLVHEKSKQYKFIFIDEVLENLNYLSFTKNTIVEPIYVSNNKILN